MKLNEIYLNNKTQISCEIFPPKNDDDGSKTEQLFLETEKIKQFNPALISVTYGAGGSNRDKSYNIVKRLSETNYNVMPHFTCVCSSKEQINSYLEDLKKLNIENILALRGDEPQDNNICYLDFRYANELVEYLTQKTDFSIAVAGYPEGHILAQDLKTDIENLKKKLNAGSDVIFTQMFFDNDKFFEYVELLEKSKINTPVVAGILPILSYKQLEKMLSLAKVTIPKKLAEQLEKFKDNKDDIKKIGIDFATEQCQNLIDNATSGIHFYTLNKSFSTIKILENLNYATCI
ncbi:methylenetetrahydrofolate reductase [bacterium]|nr:methylenetetrahydrofolate reductase [NAD(P)H] [bacterium]